MAEPRRWYTVLHIQVLIAIAAGALIGHYLPNTGVASISRWEGELDAPSSRRRWCIRSRSARSPSSNRS